MRLIDADELINQGYEIVVDGLQYDTCDKSIDIDDIPTAYDIDKVVAKLEELRDMYDDCIKNFAIRRIIEKAIEIVKQCGVEKDVNK